MNAPSRELSDEQWSRIGDPNVSPKLKRLAGTIGFMGVLLGVGAIAGLLFTLGGGFHWREITLTSPPSPVAASLSFFAIPFGVVAFWSVKQIPGRGGTRVLGVAALLLGLAGPPIYAYQSFQIHIQLQTGEINKVQALTRAAMAFQQKQGRFPKDLLELVQSAGLGPDAVKTAFGSLSTLKEIPADLKQLEDQSDFVYLAGNIDKAIPAQYQAAVIIVRDKHVLLESQSAAVGFADGNTRWVSLEEATKLYDADTDARAKMGAATRPTPETMTH